jgi:hypothetical protein
VTPSTEHIFNDDGTLNAEIAEEFSSNIVVAGQTTKMLV